MAKEIRPMIITQRDIMKGVRIPLPKKTGGVHKRTNRNSRQETKIALRRDDW